MTFKQIVEVPKNHRLVINIPSTFPEKHKVIVVVDDITETNERKLALLKKAANDPLYLSDMEEVNQDFDPLDSETL